MSAAARADRDKVGQEGQRRAHFACCTSLQQKNSNTPQFSCFASAKLQRLLSLLALLVQNYKTTKTEVKKGDGKENQDDHEEEGGRFV